MKKRILAGGFLAAALLVPVCFALLFSVPAQPELSNVGVLPQSERQGCYQYDSGRLLDRDGKIQVVVWNIYKQNRSDWQAELSQLTQHADLLLLQEASLTPPLDRWLQSGNWKATQVNAFRVLGESAGVLNAARVAPQQVCGYTAMEPWLRLPKSGLVAFYPLSSGQSLALVNLHAVNFTLGTEEYHAQIRQLLSKLKSHQGPVIVAGDFNSWSEERSAVVQRAMSALGMQEVRFTPDQRVRFINGLPLDHVFYKHLYLQTAEAPVSDASDHNPLLVTFSLTQ